MASTNEQRVAEIDKQIAELQARLAGNGSISDKFQIAKQIQALAIERQSASQGALSDFKDETEAINERRDATTGELAGELEGLETAAGEANDADAVALEEYLANLGQYNDPLDASAHVGDMESEAALAEADPNSIAAQQKLLKQYQSLTDPTVTAKERFLMEQSRIQEEQDRASAMDAALRDLEYRGARSGGAEIAALTGAQNITSQNRMLQDLGTAAGAVDRSMQAMEGVGKTAGDIRTMSFDEDFDRGSATDKVGMFNKKLLSDYTTWKDDYAAGERDKAVERGASAYDARNNTTNRGFGRAGMTYGEREDLAGMKLGVEGDKEGGAANYVQLLLGEEAARRAEANLKEKERSGADKVFDPLDVDEIDLGDI